MTPNLAICLARDAANYGIGADLSHAFPDSSKHPIAFKMSTQHSSEQKYTQVKEEARRVLNALVDTSSSW